MRRYLLYILLFTSLSAAAQYHVGNTKITFKDVSRGNRNVLTFIYYPATADSTNAPVANDTSRFPVISFGHGFVMSSLAYQWLVQALVPYGYIIAFPATEEGVPPNHSDFGKDEVFVARSVKALGDSSASILYNHTNGYTAVGGHSMGGGASFLGMQNINDITAFFNFSAAETFITESAIQAAKKCTKPALVFTGTKDCIAPAVGNSKSMYTNLASTYKFFADIHDASHCQFGDPNKTPCEVGEAVACPNSVYISSTEQKRKVMLLLKPWLDFWLKRDCGSIDTFYTNIDSNLADIDTLQSKVIDCSAINVLTAIHQVKSIKATVFPNPASGLFTLNVKENYESGTVTLMNFAGKTINQQTFINQPDIHLDYSQLPKGIYQLQMKSEKGSYTSLIIIK